MKDRGKLGTNHNVLAGAFDVIENLTNAIRCVGWAIDPSRKLPAKEVIIMDGERILGKGITVIERKDVAEYIGSDSVIKCGWEIYINKKDVTTESKLKAYAYIAEQEEVILLSNEYSMTKCLVEYTPYSKCTIDISGGCNAKCPWCVTGRKNKDGREALISFMKKEEFVEIVEYMLSNGIINQGTRIELYNWGEPFINPDFKGIVKYLGKKELDFYISTNASRVVEFNEKSELRHLKGITFSMSGMTQESYDKMHRFDIETIKKNIKRIIENFKACGFKGEASISFHIYQHNYDELKVVKDFAAALDIKVNAFHALFTDYEMFTSYIEKTIPQELLYEASRELVLYYIEGKIKERNLEYRCPQLNSLVIDYRGQVVSCCVLNDQVQDYALGVIKELSLKDIVNLKSNMIVCELCKKNKLDYIYHNTNQVK